MEFKIPAGKDLRLVSGSPMDTLVFAEMAKGRYAGGCIFPLSQKEFIAMPDGLIPTVCNGDFIAGRLLGTRDGFWYQISTGRVQRLLCDDPNAWVEPMGVDANHALGRLEWGLGHGDVAAVWEVDRETNSPRRFSEHVDRKVSQGVRFVSGDEFYGSMNALPTIWNSNGDVRHQFSANGIDFLSHGDWHIAPQIEVEGGTVKAVLDGDLLLWFRFHAHHVRQNSGEGGSVSILIRGGDEFVCPRDFSEVGFSPGEPGRAAPLWGNVFSKSTSRQYAYASWTPPQDLRRLYQNWSYCETPLVRIVGGSQLLVYDYGGGYTLTPIAK